MSWNGSHLRARALVVATLALAGAGGLSACESVEQTATAADPATAATTTTATTPDPIGTTRSAGEPRATLAGTLRDSDR
jgi:hypothetical protein